MKDLEIEYVTTSKAMSASYGKRDVLKRAIPCVKATYIQLQAQVMPQVLREY